MTEAEEGDFNTHKELGNAAFKENQFEKAIEHYSQALTSAPLESQHLILSNRAAALLALNQFASALEDCQKVVELNPSFLKGFMRMAQGLFSQHRGGARPM